MFFFSKNAVAGLCYHVFCQNACDNCFYIIKISTFPVSLLPFGGKIKGASPIKLYAATRVTPWALCAGVRRAEATAPRRSRKLLRQARSS